MIRPIRRAILPIAISCLCLAAPSSDAQVPALLNYQGSIQTTADSLLNGPVEIAFSIYAEETGGSPLWSERRSIAVTDGRFHVLLGSATPLPEDLFSGHSRYLALKIDSDDELRPRQRIVSVAYALRAGRADDVPGRPISPKSIVLAGGRAGWDTTGGLTAPRILADSLGIRTAGTVIDARGNWTGGAVSAPRVTTDSLVVGGAGVIDRTGNWVGPPVPVTVSGMRLDTLIVRDALQDTLNFGSPGRWQDIDGATEALTAPIRLTRPALFDIQFVGTAVTGWPFESRIAVKTDSQPPRPVGNTSGFSGGGWGALNNVAVLSVDAGFHRVYIEGMTSSSRVAGILIVRVYTR